MNHARPSRIARDSKATPDVWRLNALVLRLYEAANFDGDVSAFQDRAISIVEEVVSFRGSWWGSGVITASGYQVHGSHLHNLPEDVPQLLNTTLPDSPMARASAGKPGCAFLFRSDTLYGQPALAALSERMGARQTVCITQIDHAPRGSLRFLVICRGPNELEFCDGDMQWLELLHPHLNAALDLCCSAQMARWRRILSGGQLLAASDAKGFLHLSEPGVAELIAEEWPRWSGDRLPDELVDCLANGHTKLDGRQIHASFLWSGPRVLLSFRRRHLLDCLTPQERAISRAFASGQSYKAVARAVGVAPATVRHHLRSAYAKLGVSDKAALAQLVSAAPA